MAMMITKAIIQMDHILPQNDQLMGSVSLVREERYLPCSSTTISSHIISSATNKYIVQISTQYIANPQMSGRTFCRTQILIKDVANDKIYTKGGNYMAACIISAKIHE